MGFKLKSIAGGAAGGGMLGGFQGAQLGGLVGGITGKNPFKSGDVSQVESGASYMPEYQQAGLRQAVASGQAAERTPGMGIETARGGFLNANPYLQRAIEIAQRPTTEQYLETTLPQLQSQYSKYGRFGSGGQAQAEQISRRGLARELEDKASQMTYQNYLAERQNQLTMQQKLDPLERARQLAALSTAGSQSVNTQPYAPPSLFEKGMGIAAPVASMAGGLLGSGGISSLFSDERLKENIKLLGKLENGVGVYEYNFKGNKNKELGFIAQDVEKIIPEAVNDNHPSGYKKVNYKMVRGIK